MYDGDDNPESTPSAVDPYTHVTYGNLEEELSAVKEMRCIASANKLKELVGNNCQQSGCAKKLRYIDQAVDTQGS